MLKSVMNSRVVTQARVFATLLATLLFGLAVPAHASEADLILPDLTQVTFVGGMNGRSLLMIGLLVCVAGLAFGMKNFMSLKGMPVHKSMSEISELIYETCKTYLVTQGKFILFLEIFIGAIMVVYFGVLQHMEPFKVVV
ncbi:MAG: sodium-translocating pyrophosphatase, partial [Deltaproteobacteria bacterium]|nr:sodium-translocating pyrophosphatase [Deltaproteobacteria bacterium]